MTTLSRTSGHGASFSFDDPLACISLAPHAVLRVLFDGRVEALAVGGGCPVPGVKPVVQRLEHVLIAEMPLADDGGRVTLLFQQFRQRPLVGVQPMIVPRKQDASDSHALRDASGHQRGASRRADRGDVEAGELRPFLRHAIEVRRADIRCAVTPEIAVTQIIRQNDDDVRLLRSLGGTG